MKRIFSLLAAFTLSVPFLGAQENDGISADVFYLMPEMTQGTLVFQGKPPISGKFNLCAVDMTVRFLDAKGTELAMDDDSSLLRVLFDEATFAYQDRQFYRLTPLNQDISVAILREVLVMTDAKSASYGMESNTTAVQEIGQIQGDGNLVNFNDVRQYPYRMSKSAFLYRDGTVLRWSKRNAVKCFPARKADIEAWFSAHKKVGASDIDTILEVCKEWAK